MVVDDNIDSAHTFSQLLQWAGCTTHEVNEGAKAIDAAKTFQPDVIVLGIGRPGVDGYQIARLIRQTPELSRVRLIAITGYDHPEYLARSRAAGFDDHLVKPVEIGYLVQRLRVTN